MKKYVTIDSKKIISYKGKCYNVLDTILSKKRDYQDVLKGYLDKKSDIDKKINSLNEKIIDLICKINELNDQIARLEVNIYTCSYKYESLSKQRMHSFNDFKNDLISINDHKKINIEIDDNLEMLKKQYDRLVSEFNILNERKNHLKDICLKYKNQKKELLIARKRYSKNISIAKANIDVCNSNMDSVNKTLENIDMYYFSDTEEVLEDKIHPKVKKYKKIKE